MRGKRQLNLFIIKVIISLLKISLIHRDLFYDLFINFLKHQSGTDVSQVSLKSVHLCLEDEYLTGL